VRKHHVAMASVAAVLLLIASGCPVYVPGPSTGPGPGPVPTGSPATLIISNTSAEDVHYIHMSPSTDTSWGPDLLGADVLPIGASFTISGVVAGQWDVAVYDASGNCKLFMQQWFDANTQYTLDVSTDGWTPPEQCPQAHK
jgi:hypothetical protein